MSNAIANALDDVVDVERIAFNIGFDEGLARGRMDGIAHGRELGYQKGFELASEVGYYAGCARAMAHCARMNVDASVFTPRVLRMIAQLDEMCARASLADPTDADVLARCDALRGKFKTIVAAIGKREAYVEARDGGIRDGAF